MEKRKISNTNADVLIALGSITFYGLIYIATANPELIKAAYYQIPFYLVFSTVPLLNKKGHTSLGRWLFCLSLTGLTPESAAVIQWVSADRPSLWTGKSCN
jgi:hypothetical protein